MKRIIRTVMLGVIVGFAYPAAAAPSLFSKAQANNTTQTGTNSASVNIGSASAQVETAYGINRAQSFAGTGQVGQGTSRWLDVLMISSPNPADMGMSFVATFTYHLGGSQSVSATNGGDSFVKFDFTYDPHDNTNFGEQNSNQTFDFAGGGTQNIDVTHSFNFHFIVGEAFEFQSQLFVSADYGNTSGSSTTNFFSTATFTGVTLPPGFTMTSQSGTVYPISAVPEPSTCLAALLGLAAIGGHAIARRFRAGRRLPLS